MGHLRPRVRELIPTIGREKGDPPGMLLGRILIPPGVERVMTTEFNMRQFSWHPTTATFTAEASDLGLAGGFPDEFVIRSNRTGSVRRFEEYRREVDAEQDLQFVEYRDEAHEFTAIVYND